MSHPTETPSAAGEPGALAVGGVPVAAIGVAGSGRQPGGGAGPAAFGSAGAVVLLDGVVARDAAGARGGSRGSLQGVSAGLGAGVNVFLGAPEDGTIALCDVLAGVRRPLRGAVRFGHLDPWSSPAARARIGALLASPDLPDAGTVRAVAELAFAALGRPASAVEAALSELGLGALASRRAAALSFAEARAVELALAVAIAKAAPSPALAVLFEPCGDVAVPGGARAIDDAIGSLRATGACVVIATSSTADARRFADVLWTLHRGAILRRDTGGKALVAGDTEIAVWLDAAGGPAARALASALAESSAIRGAVWEDPGQPGRPPVLRVRGPERDACALAVTDAAARLGIAVQAITSAVPDLQHVRAAALARYQRPTPPARPAGPPARGPAVGEQPPGLPARGPEVVEQPPGPPARGPVGDDRPPGPPASPPVGDGALSGRGPERMVEGELLPEFPVGDAALPEPAGGMVEGGPHAQPPVRGRS